MRSMEDVRSWLSLPNTGTVETAGAPWWRLAKHLSPSIRTVVIRRPVEDVVDSLIRCGMTVDRSLLLKAMTKLDYKLDQIEQRMEGVYSIQYDQLSLESTCSNLFEYCLQQPHDHKWWSFYCGLNLQINMRTLADYCVSYRPQMVRATSQAKQYSLRIMSRGRSIDTESMVLSEERFRDFYRDGVPLFKEHMGEIGETPEMYREKNIPLMERLDDLGCLQIITARCNGRMFGYLMTVLSPSLEGEEQMSSVNTTFFVSPSAPGLGLKLHRMAEQKLIDKGVSDLFMREGVRGSGPQMGTIYRRMGAEPAGELYRLNLKKER